MSIPKKIHYCWFGGAELPELAIRCMESWKKYCPDYEIIRWDERNSDLESCQFVREAYAAKKWAFVSDYMRLKVVEEHGGIYLDIDVELLKSLDPFLEYQGFMGFEQAKPYCVSTGLGFGAVAHHLVIQMLMANYEKTPFVKEDGSFDMVPCPARDTKILVSLGLRQQNVKQNMQEILIYPFEFFSPVSVNGVVNLSNNSVAIHHFNGAWLSETSKKSANRKRMLVKKYGLFWGGKISFILRGFDDFRENGMLFVLNKILGKF